MRWRGVVLDVDDTLYLEREYVRSGFEAVGRHVATHHGLKGFSETAWSMFVDGRRGDTFDAALSSLGGAGVPVQELVAIYRGHAPTIQLLDDSRSVLEALVDTGTPVAVITDGPAASQWAKVRALGLEQFADVIVVTTDLGPGRGKPHEASYLHVEKELGLRGDELVYIADNPEKDFIAPDRLGWGTVRVRRSGSLHEAVDSGDDVTTEVADLAALDIH